MDSPKSDDANTEGSNNENKIRIKFIFANRDGVNVEVEYAPTDTIDTVKTLLQESWPKEINDTPPKSDRIRLICMGKGVLSPGSMSLEQCELPVFLTHPTPVNVSVRPIMMDQKDSRKSSNTVSGQTAANPSSNSSGECCCVLM
mmetsp:Transcript_22683/g.27821  ORF Transcript_22683/g.27821 Transcript_22683/m.27821 type:complete len:144 (-) Transcript_22683:136-567(-)